MQSLNEPVLHIEGVGLCSVLVLCTGFEAESTILLQSCLVVEVYATFTACQRIVH